MLRTRVLAAAGATTLAAALLTVTSPAGAAGALGVPGAARVAGVSASALTVTLPRVANATGYRLYVSATRSDVYVANLGRARRSALSRTPRMTVTGLPYRTTPYYFRVQAFRGTGHRTDPVIHAVGLRPAAPTAVRATGSAAGTWLTWRPAAATGVDVLQSTDRAADSGRRLYTVRGLCPQFTPYGLAAGHDYWFRVRSVNQSTRSSWSAPVQVTARTGEQPMTVMTYNVLEGDSAGSVEGGQTIPSWAARRPGVVALIRGQAPDVVAVQEAAAWVGLPQGRGGTRQVDDLAAAMPEFALADTETPPSRPYYLRTGNYLLYRTSTYTAVGAGGHWDLGGHFAAYQLLQRRATGARVVVVSAHLAVGAGASNDRIRQAETQSLIDQAQAYAASVHAPVVYAGDFNSTVNRNHAFDGSGLAMRAALAPDAEEVAPVQVNGLFNSSNLYLRRPPAMDQSIDHVYAPPGVSVQSRTVVVRLVHGAFSGVIPSDHNPVAVRIRFAG